jgi:fructose-specific phosphotransferase system IIC component
MCISVAILFNNRKHWQTYQQAEYTWEKMVRNLSFDLLGFLLAMGAAMVVGSLAGKYIGLRAGFWFGLLAGFVGGFLAAWLVRSAWGRLVLARI